MVPKQCQKGQRKLNRVWKGKEIGFRKKKEYYHQNLHGKELRKDGRTIGPINVLPYLVQVEGRDLKGLGRFGGTAGISRKKKGQPDRTCEEVLSFTAEKKRKKGRWPSSISPIQKKARTTFGTKPVGSVEGG